MLGISGFKTKKDLKNGIGKTFRPIETSIFGSEFKGDGKYVVVGPNPHERKWFATVTVKDYKIIKVS